MSEHVAYEVVDLLDLTPFPGNARVHDLDEIKTSLVKYGQYRTIVVWRTEGRQFVVAGNGTRQAMLDLSRMDLVTYEQTYATLVGGSEHLRSFSGKCRIELTTFDGWDEARRVNATDNRLTELGAYDDEALIAQLEQFGSDFAGTGWTPEDLAALRAEWNPDGGSPPPLDQLTPRLCQRCGYDVANDPLDLAGGHIVGYKIGGQIYAPADVEIVIADG